MSLGDRTSCSKDSCGGQSQRVNPDLHVCIYFSKFVGAQNWLAGEKPQKLSATI